MNKFLRWYYRNKVKFWIRVLIIVGIYLLILLLDSISEKSLEKEISEQNFSNKINYVNKHSIKSEETIIGTQTKKEDIKNANEIIDAFIKYCNNEEPEKAYELISEECKEEMYPTLQDFINSYYKNIFSVSKTYKMQNWSGNIYKIEYRDSLLATGGVEKDFFIRDYITVEKKKDITKLNINNYVGRKEINRGKTIDNIKINVLSKDVYMEYEIYNIQIENNSRNDFLLDNLQNSTSIFIKDSKENKHYAYLNELTEEMLTVKVNQIKDISIKFTNSYITNSKVDNINFLRLITNINEKNNKKNIVIEL